MIIEITGVNTWNKGAELMLVAIQQHIESRFPGVKLAVDSSFGSYADKSKYGLTQKVNRGRWGKTRLALGLLSRPWRDAYGLAFDEDVDAVLDASGFAFGDQHPAERITRFADQVESWKAAGKPVILLPQALGPFESDVHRTSFKRIASSATHIFARDPISFEYAGAAAGSADNMSMAPDFTNLVHPGVERSTTDRLTACIVPNQRMIEKAVTPDAAAAYVPMLERMVHLLEDRGFTCFILVHGAHDASLAESLRRRLHDGIVIVRETDPVRIKARLGATDLVVASRFHALISALSQGVPAIATSWSHKYEQLFDEYDCSDLVLPVPCSPERIGRAIDRVSSKSRDTLIETIKERGRILTDQTHRMWNEVESMVGLTGPDRA